MSAQIIDGKALAAATKAEAAAEAAALKAKGIEPCLAVILVGEPRQPGVCARQGKGLRRMRHQEPGTAHAGNHHPGRTAGQNCRAGSRQNRKRHSGSAAAAQADR